RDRSVNAARGTHRFTAGEPDTGTRSAMTGLLTRARFVLGAVAIAGFIAVAAPAHAQQSAPVDPDASVVNEQTLLREAPRIEGLIDQPDGRARVLVQPAGRMW